jgi:hypothetical protein
MDRSLRRSPTCDILKEQFKELNSRSRWYSGQLWYIPFAYFGLVSLTLGNVVAREPKFIGAALLFCGIVGILVFWHMLGIKDGEKRAVENLQAVEIKLGLDKTVEYKGYTLAFFIGVFVVLMACLLGGILFLCSSLRCVNT